LTREAFKRLFDLYFDEIRKYIYYRGGDSDLAEDVTQQAFMRIWEKQISIHPGSEKGLIYKIAKNEFIDQIRKRKYEAHFEDSLLLEAKELPADALMEYKELSQRFQGILNMMNEKHRVVFLMSRNDELKYHEIADRLNISVKAVEKRMKGALQVLKAEFKTV